MVYTLEEAMYLCNSDLGRKMYLNIAVWVFLIGSIICILYTYLTITQFPSISRTSTPRNSIIALIVNQ